MLSKRETKVCMYQMKKKIVWIGIKKIQKFNLEISSRKFYKKKTLYVH